MWGWNQTTVGDLQQEMTGTTAVFGRDKGVTVTFEGDVAKSSDGNITFPSLDPTITLDTATVKLMRGWVDSESAIARFTNKGVYNQERDPKLQAMFKAVEGARVENKYTEYYGGAGKNLAQLSTATFDELKKDENTDMTAEAISMFARGRMDGVFNTWDERQMESFIDKAKINGFVDQIEGLESTEQALALAQQIIEQQEQEQEQEQEGEGQGEGEGQDGQPDKGDSDSGDGESEGDDSSKDEGEGDEGNKGDSGQAESKVNSVGDIINSHIEKKVNQDIQKKWVGFNGNASRARPFKPLTTEYDRDLHWSDGWGEDVGLYIDAKEHLGSGLATAKRKLELLIQSTQKLSWDSYKEMGKFDSKRMVGAYQGEENVFKIKQDESDLDTAVSICIDLSDSMSGNKAYDAFRSTIVLAELLHKIGVPFEITGFDAGRDGMDDSLWRNCDDDAFGRTTSLRHHWFKKFSDKFFDARKYMHRIATLEGSGDGNADSESVLRSAKSLMKRPEKRRILFVLSDGNPCAGGNRATLCKHLKDTVKNIEKYIDVVGIGIQSSAVEDYYAKSIVINDSRNLPETLLDLLGEKLLPKKKGMVA